MAVAAIADQVDDDIGVEAVAVLGGDGRDADDGVGIFRVDVEDGDGQALGDVGGEARGVGLFRHGGEAEEIVHDDVDGSADVEAGERAEDEAFGEDALAGEGRVAVHADGQDLVAGLLLAVGEGEANLLGAGAAHGDGIDGFEVAGVRDEMQRDGAALGRAVLAGRAHVVLHVAAAENAARVDVFKAGEDLRRANGRWCWSSRSGVRDGSWRGRRCRCRAPSW